MSYSSFICVLFKKNLCLKIIKFANIRFFIKIAEFSPKAKIKLANYIGDFDNLQ